MTVCLIEIWRPRPEWYKASEEEKRDFISQFPRFVEDLGKRGIVVRGSYRCRFGSEWDMFAVIEMPDYETVEYMAELVEDLGWNRYFEQVNVVGRHIDQLDYERHLLAPKGQRPKDKSYVSKERLG